MTLALLPALLGLALLASPAAGTKDVAAPRCTLHIDTGAREERALGGDALREALARASGCEIASGRRAPAVLRVRLVGGRARLELRVQGRAALVRAVVLDADPEERIEAIVIVATHMLRNEADELLGLLGRRGEATDDDDERATDEPATPPDTETAAAAEETSLPSAPSDASAPEIGAAVEATTGVEATTEPANETPTEASGAAGATSVIAEDAEPEGAHPERAPPIVRLGLTSLVSSVPSGTGAEATLIGGLELAATPTPWLALGVRDLLGSALPTQRWSFGGGLFAELSLRLLEWLALEGQLGADVRVIGLGDRQSAGVAPFVVVGARAFLARELSIALDMGLHAVATEVWATTLHLVPRGAVVWSGGAAIAVHL